MRRILRLMGLIGCVAAAAVVATDGSGDAVAPSRADILEIRDVEVLAAGMAAPTDVTFGDDGEVYILDGYGGEIRVIDTSGSEREPIPVRGEPVGIAWGEGSLWVPHTDEPLLSRIDPDSGEADDLPVQVGGVGLRLTDVVIRGDHAVVASNYGGPWRLPLDGGEGEPIPLDPRVGIGFHVAADGDRTYVVDVLEDRIVVFEGDGEEQEAVGKWGVWEGTFVHPSGVAVDRRGRLFVADGMLGVIQVFDSKGAFLGALGRDGELLRLEHPMGLAVDGDRLVVVDWGSGRALAMTVDDRTRPLTGQGMYERKVPRISYLEGEISPITLLPPVCQSCHDGTLLSSAHVWDDSLQAHPFDEIPRKPIPAPFTLDGDGKMYCGTCHIPHRMGDAAEADGEQLEVFLKEPRARSQLCLACHTDVVAEVREVAGPIPDEEAGHIVGEVPRDVPRRGVAAIESDVTAVECLDCHTPHGAVGTMLLSPGAATAEGCTRCHVGVSPDRGARTHPVDRQLTDVDAVAALRMRGVFLAPGDTVACLTCHDVHTSPQRQQLTTKMSANERCIVCHRPQSSLQGGGHDLREGQGGHVATACLACHTVHEASGPALMRMGGDLNDPTGCQGCHGEGGHADSRIDPGAAHPLFERNEAPGELPSVDASGTRSLGAAGETGCLTCHDPHAGDRGGANPAMLRRPGSDADTCLSCHLEQAPVRGSDHDLRLTESARSRGRQDEMTSAGFCAACHGMHEAGEWHLWNAPLGGSSSESMASRTCLGCHRSGNDAGGTVVRVWEHPDELLLTTAKLPWQNTGELPLYDSNGRPTDDKQLGSITCLTCHDPHVWSPKRGGSGGTGEGDTRTSFLREGWKGFCAGCHGEEALAVYRYFHDPEFREEMRDRNERRDWPIYGEDDR